MIVKRTKSPNINILGKACQVLSIDKEESVTYSHFTIINATIQFD